jgi:hypothetical protein
MNQKAVAYHEAGHAVAELAQGRKIRSVSIVPDDITAGHSEGYARSRAFLDALAGATWWSLEPRYKDRLEKEVRILLAGEVAQRRFAPRSFRRQHIRYGFHGDMPEVERLLGCVVCSDHERDAYLKLLKIQTEWLIDRHWPIVEAIAAALSERQSLTGHEALEIFGAARMAQARASSAPVQKQRLSHEEMQKVFFGK